MTRHSLPTVPDAERVPTIPAPAAEPTYHWPTDLPPLSLRLLREVAECLRARPVSGDGEGLTWSLNGCSDGREFFRMGP